MALYDTRPNARNGRLIGDGNKRLCIELYDSQYNVWTNLSDDWEGCTWDRGNVAHHGRPDTGTLTMRLRNDTGKWDPAKSMFTLINWAKAGSLVRLGIVGDNLANYITTPGMTVAHEPSLNTTGAFQCAVDVQLADWSPSATIYLAGKRVGGPSGITGTGSWRLNLINTGQLQVLWTDTAQRTFSSTANLSALANGTRQWVAFTFRPNVSGNRVVRFWTSTDGTTWTELGTAVSVTGAAAYTANTAPVYVMGAGSGDNRAYAWQLRNGTNADGTLSTSATVISSGNFTSLAATPWTWEDLTMPATVGPDVTFEQAGLVFTPSGTSWVPVFVGRVETWTKGQEASGAYRYAEITASETSAYLASINRNALGSVTGGGENLTARLARLLTQNIQTAWPYGSANDVGAPAANAFQGTDLANNRLSEAHLTADSADCYFRSHRSGAAIFTDTDARQTRAAANPASEPDRSIYGRASRDVYPAGFTFRAGNTALAPAPYWSIGSGKRITIPDSANMDITGDITVWVDVALDNWANGSYQVLAGKRDNVNQNSWTFQVTNDGRLRFAWYPTGTGASVLIADSSVALPVVARERAIVGVSLDVVNGSNRILKFWCYPPDSYVSGFSGAPDWPDTDGQLGTTITTAATTSIFNSTAPITIGADDGGSVHATGRLYGFGMTNAIATNTAMSGASNRLNVRPENVPTDPAATTFEAPPLAVTATMIGAMLVTPADVVYDSDSLGTTSDLDTFITSARLARKGGTQQVSTVTMSGSTQLLGPDEINRADLLNNTDADVLNLARRLRRRFSSLGFRPTGATITAKSPAELTAVAVLDLQDLVEVVEPSAQRGTAASISGMTHNVVPLTSRSVHWRATYTLSGYATL